MYLLHEKGVAGSILPNALNSLFCQHFQRLQLSIRRPSKANKKLEPYEGQKKILMEHCLRNVRGWKKPSGAISPSATRILTVAPDIDGSTV